MDKEIQIVYKPNIETLTKASRYLLNNSRLKFIPIYFIVIASVTYWSGHVGLKPEYRDEEFKIADLFPFIIFPAVFIFIYFRTLSVMKKTILSNKRNFELQKITFTDNSYVQEGETFKVESFWNETFQIKETKDWFLIYPKKNSALPIIKSDLKDNEYNELKALFNSLDVKKSLK